MQDQSQSFLANGLDRCADSSFAEILRAEICSNPDLSFLMEAHDALSGAIAKQAGFKGLWRRAYQLPALSATAMPTKLHGAKSSTWSSASSIRPSCRCSLTAMAASGISTMPASWRADSVSGALPGLRWRTAVFRR